MDDELDQLLDSALTDFNENKNEAKNNTQLATSTEALSTATSTTTTKTATSSTTNSSRSTVIIEDTNIIAEEEPGERFDAEELKVFDEIFSDAKAKESLKQFQDALNMLKSDEPNLIHDFEKMMSQLTTEDLDEDDVNDDDDDLKDFDFVNLAKSLDKMKQQTQGKETSSTASATNAKSQDPLSKVLDDMNKQSEKIKNSNFGAGENLFADLLNIAGGGGGDASDDDLESSLLMQPLISMLFSKEVLHPSLKLMLTNYDKYLEDNIAKKGTGDYDKCIKQRECIVEMCNVYESAKESDNQEEKSKQLKKILELLEKCGHPPKEVVPDANPFGSLGAMGMNDNCPIS